MYEVVVSQSKLGFIKGVSEGVWLADVEVASRTIKRLQFILGDLLLRGEQAFGDDAYAKASAVAGLDPETLRHYAWVAKKVPEQARHAELSFSHHRQVAILGLGEQMAWLTRAHAEKLSVAQLKEAIRAARPPKPRVTEAAPGPIHQITVNLSEEHYTAFCEMARAEGETPGALLERVALAALEDSLYVQQRGGV